MQTQSLGFFMHYLFQCCSNLEAELCRQCCTMMVGVLRQALPCTVMAPCLLPDGILGANTATSTECSGLSLARWAFWYVWAFVGAQPDLPLIAPLHVNNHQCITLAQSEHVPLEISKQLALSCPHGARLQCYCRCGRHKGHQSHSYERTPLPPHLPILSSWLCDQKSRPAQIHPDGPLLRGASVSCPSLDHGVNMGLESICKIPFERLPKTKILWENKYIVQLECWHHLGIESASKLSATSQNPGYFAFWQCTFFCAIWTVMVCVCFSPHQMGLTSKKQLYFFKSMFVSSFPPPFPPT